MGGIDLTGCAKLLGWPLPRVWCRWQVGKFVSPAVTKNDQPFWREDDVYRWAVRTHLTLINRVPIRYWPDAERPAAYRGAREIEDVVVQTWKADAGTVCVLWSRPRPGGKLPLRRVAAELPDAAALVHVQLDFGIDGPGLSTAEPGNLTQWRPFGASCAELARVLGQPVPHWPNMLRIPTLIAAWEPGVPVVTYPTIPAFNTSPLLRLAATLPQDSPAHQVLLNMARTAQFSSTAATLWTTRSGCEPRPSGRPAPCSPAHS